MIRINLLPTKKAKRAEAGQRQLLYMGGAVLAFVGAVVFFHIQTSNELDELSRQNRLVQADIDRLKAEMGDYDKVKAQRENLLKQRQTIQALQLGRTGPVYLMRELSEILTPGKGPTFDRIAYEEQLRRDPSSGFNASWDTRHLWIDTYEEDQKRVKIKGGAKSTEDVAEFLKRLQASVFFKDVNAEGTSQAQASGGSVKSTTFSVTATVIY